MNDTVLDFETIHEEFRSKIQHYLARMVGEFEAEDLTQEVFLRVDRALATFKGDSRLSTWVYRIATNAALDRLRSPAFKYGAWDGLPADLGEDQESVQAETPSPEDQLFHQERVACYCDFVGALPVNYRTVVALSELEDLAVGEIAEILGLSEQVVKIRLHRGRARLIRELKSHCKPEDWL